MAKGFRRMRREDSSLTVDIDYTAPIEADHVLLEMDRFHVNQMPWTLLLSGVTRASVSARKKKDRCREPFEKCTRHNRDNMVSLWTVPGFQVIRPYA